MSTEKKFKTALDETRLLMLGSQIFFGFQFNGIFQTAFDTVSATAKTLDAAGLLLMTLTIGLLIGPSARHRLANRGTIDSGLFRTTAVFAGLALLPFSLSFAIDVYIVMARLLGETAGWAIAAFCWATALIFWYGLEFLSRDKALVKTAMARELRKQVSISVRIEQMLTEARVVLPGAQALLAFQLLAMLTQAFDRLPRQSQLLHAVALGAIAITVILLIAPAAFHRIAFNGTDSARFYDIGSRLVTVALFPLALGMALDIYVAATKLLGDPTLAGAAGLGIFILLLILWYAYPLLLRRFEPDNP